MDHAAEFTAMQPDERVDELARIEREINMLHARQLSLIGVMHAADRASADALAKDWTREDVAAALRLSPYSAADRLEFAKALGRMPRLLAVLSTGDITMLHARIAARSVLRLADEQVDAVFDRVLPRAPQQTVGQFADSVRRAVLAVAPEYATQQRERAMQDRRVAYRPVDHGMAELWAFLPAEGAAALMDRLDADAGRANPGDERTLEQRRADALVGMALGSTGGSHPLRPAVHVTVAASTVAGLDDQPGELAGHGPIPAALARALAFDPSGTWQRVLTDDTGTLLDYGRRTYRPPARLDRHIRARDRGCRFPGCTRRAQRCDIDHRVAWTDGGHTNAQNLHLLCARHHAVKHEAGWRVRCQPDGATIWTSRTGHIYRVPPATCPLDTTFTGVAGHDPPL